MKMKRNLLIFLTLLAASSMNGFAQAGPDPAASIPNNANTKLMEKSSLPPEVAASLPNCKKTNPSVPFPTGPHGLYVVFFPGSPLTEEAGRLILHNPTICGVVFYVVWSQADKGTGASPRYDFSATEKQIAPWVAAGKAVSLIVWAVSDAHGLVATPDYVLAKVPTVECTKFGRVPVFWDEQFVTPYKEFMAAVMHKYGSDRRISYIRFGLAQGGETYPGCATVLQPEKGLTQDLWKNYILGMLDYEHSLKHTRQLMLGINTWGQPPDNSLALDEAERAAKYGFGVGGQGLQVSNIETYNSGGICNANWCNVFDQYVGKIPLELQMLRPSDPDGTGVGSWVDVMPFAIKRHAQIIELLLPDIIAAYGTDSTGAMSQYSAGYQAAFTNAAKILGGSAR
jgi:hypothetical protein